MDPRKKTVKLILCGLVALTLWLLIPMPEAPLIILAGGLGLIPRCGDCGLSCFNTCFCGTVTGQVQFDVAGIANPGHCAGCAGLNGTYVNFFPTDSCFYQAQSVAVAECGGGPGRLTLTHVWGQALSGLTQKAYVASAGYNTAIPSSAFWQDTAGPFDCGAPIGARAATSVPVNAGCDFTNITLGTTPL